jgi:hypothetical protein
MASPRLLEVLDRLQEGVVWAMLAWLPFAFGGVLPLSHMVLVGGTAILALLFGLRCVVGRGRVVGSWSLVPLLLFVGLVAVQAMPGRAICCRGSPRRIIGCGPNWRARRRWMRGWGR